MNPIFLVPAIRLVLLTLLLGVPFLARAEAQDSTAVSDSVTVSREPTSEDRARELLAQLDSEREEITALLRSANRSNAGEFEIKRVAAYRIVDRMERLTRDLSRVLVEMDSTTARRDSLYGAAASHMRFQASIYAEAFNHSVEDVNRLQRRRPDVEAQSAPNLEAELASVEERIGIAVSLMKSTAERMDILGFDTESLWKGYDEALVERAEHLAGRLELASAERDRLHEQDESVRKSGGDNPDQAARLQAAEIRVETLVKSLQHIAHVMEARGLPSAQYLQLTFRTTGAVTDDLLNLDVLKGLVLDLYEELRDWLKLNGPTILLRFLIVFVIVMATRFLLWAIWILARLRMRSSRLLRDLISRLIAPTGTVFGLLLGMWTLGVDPTTLLAGLGVAGVIVGLALQDSLANFAAGVFILIYKPYDVDDYVQAGGVLGKVRQMGLANTLIVTFDNRRLFVPNRKIWSEVIENRSSERVRRIDTTVRVRYDENVDVVMQHCRDILQASELVLPSPAPTIFVEKLEDSWLEIAVWAWTKGDTWWDLTMELPRILHIGLAERGVRVPYPRREVNSPEDVTS